MRAVASGVLETAGTTFLLLIAVRWFEAAGWAKALVAGGGSLGFLLSPWWVSRVEQAGWRVSRAAAALAFTGSAVLLLMAVVRTPGLYVVGAAVSGACLAMTVPLMTQVFQDNYPEQQRGRLFSRTVMIRIAVAALFSELAGRALSSRMETYPWLLVVLAGAFLLAGWSMRQCPSRPLTRTEGAHPFKAMRFVRQDALFRRTLWMWMFMGFGNLMMVPLRVEYLANPRHGVTAGGEPLNVAVVALLTGVIPNVARLVMSPVWGWLFDRANFFVLRIALNLGFAAGIGTFFTSHSVLGLVVAAVLFGISSAGGDVAWSLWVTKFAPPERVADYMSVHTFFTGLRGVLAPMVAFSLIEYYTVEQVAILSVALILVGTAILLPELPQGRRGRPTGPWVEELSE
ncbi:MAG: MFS transporter [Verrucomicrobiota bacterium]|nr:MFS transporter [Limisphaera sp.]MDW8382003.1 MFS transporter [Verrucomicrobiota bacterium]